MAGDARAVNDEFFGSAHVDPEESEEEIIDDENESVYAGSEDDLMLSDDNDDEGETSTIMSCFTRYDPNCTLEDFTLSLGMKFESNKQFIAAMKNHAIHNGFNFKLSKSVESRVEMKCIEKDCPWRVYAAWNRKEQAFMVRILEGPHICAMSIENRLADYKWIANHFIEQFRMNINWPVKDMMRELTVQFGISVGKSKCYKARAREMLQGTLEDHYHSLRPYVRELRRVNPNSTIELDLIPDTTHGILRFHRLYICFESLARGFLEGCRPFIGLDGCFLKSEAKGHMLSAVGKDGNSHMLPIAWAVVEGENQDSWTWFINMLRNNLNMGDGRGWTLMSDQQKGLANAVAELLPYAEHRNCARHIYMNWRKKGHSSESLKTQFWKTVKCTSPEIFPKHLQRIAEIKPEAAHDFVSVGVEKFCMAFVQETPCCESVDNNICESFNNYILPYRGKRIIDMLQGIRHAIMHRIWKKRGLFLNNVDDLCPRVRGILKGNVHKARKCKVTRARLDEFEVEISGNEYIVNLAERRCSCRYWSISGIPCTHAIACMNVQRHDPALYIADWYKRDKYERVYSDCIPAMTGKDFWVGPLGIPIFPPLIRRQPGRPKTQRIVHASEQHNNPSRNTSTGRLVMCTICHQFGHNRRTCPRKGTQATNTGASTAVQIGMLGVEGAFDEAPHPSHRPSTCERGSSSRGFLGLSWGRKKKNIGKSADPQPGKGKFVNCTRGWRESQEQFDSLGKHFSRGTTDNEEGEEGLADSENEWDKEEHVGSGQR